MNNSDKVSEYIDKQEKFDKQLQQIRDVFQQTELLEEVKWGKPSYSLNGKLVAGIAAFKNHYAIWFHQGSFLKDNEKMLVNANEGYTRGLRQWRFEAEDTIDSDLILKYINEAIANCEAGKEIKPQKTSKKIVIPTILEDAFKNDFELSKNFKNLTPGKQREYAEHIGGAKRETTQISRLEKCSVMINEGKGLHDKYKNC